MFHSNDGGFQIDYSNGWTVSVQWGAGTYGDNHTSMTMETPSEGWTSRTAEVAAWRTNARDTEAWYDGSPNGVRGYLDASNVLEYASIISELEDIQQPIV